MQAAVLPQLAAMRVAELRQLLNRPVQRALIIGDDHVDVDDGLRREARHRRAADVLDPDEAAQAAHGRQEPSRQCTWSVTD